MEQNITISKRGYLIALCIILLCAHFKIIPPFFLNMAVEMKNDLNVSSLLAVER